MLSSSKRKINFKYFKAPKVPKRLLGQHSISQTGFQKAAESLVRIISNKSKPFKDNDDEGLNTDTSSSSSSSSTIVVETTQASTTTTFDENRLDEQEYMSMLEMLLVQKKVNPFQHSSFRNMLTKIILDNNMELLKFVLSHTCENIISGITVVEMRTIIGDCLGPPQSKKSAKLSFDCLTYLFDYSGFNFSILDDIINKKGTLSKSNNGNNSTVRHHAFLIEYACNLDILTFLLDSGANINIQHVEEGTTALMVACMSGGNQSDACIKLLLERGTDLEIKNWCGRTPLLCAAYKGYTTRVKLLLEHGADPSNTLVSTFTTDYATSLSNTSTNRRRVLMENYFRKIDDDKEGTLYTWPTEGTTFKLEFIVKKKIIVKMIKDTIESRAVVQYVMK